MKDAKSILLRRWLYAAEVDHGECAALQITCPACHEALFKVQRGGTHYFSHYSRAPTLVAECERRVDGIPLAEKEHTNATVRDQRLEYFLSVIRDAIRDMWGAGWNRLWRQMHGSKAVRNLCNNLFDSLRARPETGEKVRTQMFDIFDGRNRGKVLFSLDAHKEIASDIWDHLLTGQARKSFEVLFVFGLGHTCVGISKKLTHSEDDVFIMHCLMEMQHGASRGDIALGLLEKRNVVSSKGTLNTATEVLLSSVCYSMAAGLISIPYLDLLKKWRSQ